MTIEPPDIQDIICGRLEFVDYVDTEFDLKYNVEIYFRVSDRTYWQLVFDDVAGRECYKTIKQVKSKTVTTTKWVYVND